MTCLTMQQRSSGQNLPADFKLDNSKGTGPDNLKENFRKEERTFKFLSKMGCLCHIANKNEALCLS